MPEPVQPTTHLRETRGLPTTATYSRELWKCQCVLLQWSLVFEQQLQNFQTDKSRIIFLMGLLRGQSLDWATTIWKNQTFLCSSFKTFIMEMCKVFNHLSSTRKQPGNYSPSIKAPAVRQSTPSSSGHWQQTLDGTWRPIRGISKALKDELAARDELEGLEA